jgi:hypothetical protein
MMAAARQSTIFMPCTIRRPQGSVPTPAQAHAAVARLQP